MRFVSAAQLMAQPNHGSGVWLGVEFIEDMDVTAIIVSRITIALAVIVHVDRIGSVFRSEYHNW